MVQNNKQVQEVAQKLGTLNLMGQFFIETEDKNKEAIFGALSSFLRGNAAAKQLFIQKKGLEWLQHILLEPKMSPRMQKKVLFLINNMIDDKTKAFFSSEDNIHRYIELLILANLNLTKNWDTRENILLILNQVDKDSLSDYEKILVAHKEKLVLEMNKCKDESMDLYAKEMRLVQKVIEVKEWI